MTNNIPNNEIFEVKDGILYFEGVSTIALAEKYGTPLQVFSKKSITDRLKEINRDFVDKYPNAKAAYAAKAFLTPKMCKIVDEENFWLDVVSGGEFYTAMKAGFPAERVKYHGNNKTPQELKEAIGSGVGVIVIDALDEIDLIEEICKELGKKAKVNFRITPEVTAGAHDHITTGKRDSKFGIPMDEDILYPQIERAIKSEYVEYDGLHFHIGSQLFDNSGFLEALDHTLDIAKEVKSRFDACTPEILIGGGYGIRYVEGEERLPYSYFLDPIMERVSAFCQKEGLELPVIGIEPGRSIVGEAGITLYTAGSVKQIPDSTKYVSIDGGMCDNIRPALYGAEYEAVIANKADAPATEKVTICGKLCETGDKIIEGCMLAVAERNDIICVFSTGAYGYAMSNNYNKIPKPAVVLVDNASDSVLIKRQTYEDMIANEE